MEPVTHVLTGMCLARTGPQRRAAYATLAMAIAAELPDIDTLWGLRGPVSGFEHHRGITHTFLGIPFEAAILVALFYLFHRWRRRSADRSHKSTNLSGSLGSPPPRWGLLYGFVLLALLSHILLDYTNNYGVRPLFPFLGTWYAASIVFIFDPLIFVLLLAGLLLPSLFGFIGQEIAGTRDRLRGVAWPRTVLLCIVCLWAFRAYQHRSALTLAAGETLRAPVEETPSDAMPDATLAAARQSTRPILLPRRSLASPDPLNPFRWYVATDYGPAYQLYTADTRSQTLSAERILNKTSPDAALLAAERSRLGRVYLDWSPMPWITSTSERQGSGAETTVTFQDVRFMGSSSFLQRGGKPPLTGDVILSNSGQVLEEGMDGKFGR